MIRPVPISASYRVTVAMAAVVMVATPLCYAAFVALVAYAVFRWTFAGWGMDGGALQFMVYVAILTAGLTVLLFLAKVFFTWPKLHRPGTLLDLAAHPGLQNLVRRVCEETGAPVPAEVAVDMSLNGAASLIHPLWGLFSNRYRLTLGLPLVAISDQQHMAHVIAHEVGHFSQSGAMRVSQLIHWSEYYLVNLVNGRDKWDIWLASLTDGTVYIVQLFAWTATAGIWLSRRVLRLLLRISPLVNARMSRQMEFHADLYAIRVAGSAAFTSSVETFAAGAAAFHRALQLSNRSAAEGRYPEDLAELTARCYQAIPASDRKELARQSRYTTGLGMASHPDDTDRLEQSDREQDPGVLHEEGPAAALFTDFPALCRAESRLFFAEERQELTSAASLIAEDETRDTQAAARIQVFGVAYDGPVWLRLGAAHPARELDWKTVIGAGETARDATVSYFGGLAGAYSKWVVDTVVLRRLSGALPVDWMMFELEPCDENTARQRMYGREREYWTKVAELHAATAPIVQRLLTAHAQRGCLPEARQALFEEALGVISLLEPADEATTQMALDLAVLGDLSPAINGNLHSDAFMQSLQSEFEAALRHAQAVEEALPPPLLDVVRPERMDPEGGAVGYLNVYGNMLSRLRDKRLHAMGQLAELVLETEAAGVSPGPAGG